MPKSRLQHTEIPLYAPENGSLAPPVHDVVKIFPVESRGKIEIWIEGKPYWFSPDEAHYIGSSLVEHALEAGYDPDTDETALPED